ncbi:transcriptional coactivator Hfi1/Transcriptional adapter 1 [Globomyces pollinis-pini]|nr:transcriptional coactivator Hfi1/Transcriptional adapter 1 [Globomyces pollinis-pini]
MNNRKDTLYLKQQLADSLGESGRDYWKQLGEFLACRTTKEELDEVSSTTFTTPHQIKLHNKLISSILFNLNPQVPVPEGVDSDFVVKNPYKRKPNDALINRHLRRRYNSKVVQSLSAEERTRLLTLDQKPMPDLIDEEPIQFNPAPKGIDGIPKTCLEEGDLPSHDALRARIKFISALQDLDGSFTNDVVSLVSQALENYLKNLMSNVIQKSRSVSDDIYKLEETSPKKKIRKLYLEQLKFSLDITPQNLDTDLLESISV